MSSNENNASFEKQKKIVHSNYFEEIDLISSNPKISNTIDTSGTIEISPKDNISKKISINSSVNSSTSSSDLIYGTSIEIINPRKIGSMIAFFYIKNYPLFVIGPDCK